MIPGHGNKFNLEAPLESCADPLLHLRSRLALLARPFEPGRLHLQHVFVVEYAGINPPHTLGTSLTPNNGQIASGVQG